MACEKHTLYSGKRLGSKAKLCPGCLAYYNEQHSIAAPIGPVETTVEPVKPDRKVGRPKVQKDVPFHVYVSGLGNKALCRIDDLGSAKKVLGKEAGLIKQGDVVVYSQD